MELTYRTVTAPNSNRTIHVIVIDESVLATTRAKEVLNFAKPRLTSKWDWKHLKEAVRLGTDLTINGGE